MSLLNGSSSKTSPKWRPPWSRRTRTVDLTPFRVLALQLHRDNPPGQGNRSALLVTPSFADVASTTCLTLGVSLAEQLGGPVLVVDCTMEAGVLSKALSCEEQPGLAEVLTESRPSLSSVQLALSAPGLFFVPSGRAPFPTASAAPLLEKQLEAAAGAYSFVLLFGGMLAANPLTLALAPSAGTTLLLVVENRTSIDDLKIAQNTLRLARTRRVEVVLTSVLSGEFELPECATIRPAAP